MDYDITAERKAWHNLEASSLKYCQHCGKPLETATAYDDGEIYKDEVCKNPDFFYNSWVHGDPGGGDLIFPAYSGDPIRFITIGAQVGGQTYREVIFFENEEAIERMKQSKMEFSSQVSAVAVKSGVSKNAKYTDGVSVFTQDLAGLMAEATVGGQKFKYTAF